MSIIDSVLGGSGGNNGSGGTNAQESSSTHNFGTSVGTDPMVGASLSNLLHSSQSDHGGGSGNDGGNGGGYGDSSDFTGLGHLDFGAAAPTVVGVSSTNENSSASESHGGGGGLLGGLL